MSTQNQENKTPHDHRATYYDAGGIPSMDIIKAKLTQDQYEGYLLGTGLNYLLRANFKHAIKAERQRDIEKAEFYLGQLSDHMQESIDRLSTVGTSMEKVFATAEEARRSLED